MIVVFPDSGYPPTENSFILLKTAMNAEVAAISKDKHFANHPGKTMTGQERRKEQRYNFNGVPVLIHQGANRTGVTVDISSGGLGLIMAAPLEAGTETTLELFHQRIRIGGTITHLFGIAKDRYQLGVSFRDIKPGLVEGMMAVWDYKHSAAARYV